jgi:hypothetical protein
METVEIRCPVGPRRLFAKFRMEEGTPHITSDNLFEVSCPDCTKLCRKKQDNVGRVLHRFNFFGQLVESEVVGYEDMHKV